MVCSASHNQLWCAAFSAAPCDTVSAPGLLKFCWHGRKGKKWLAMRNCKCSCTAAWHVSFLALSGLQTLDNSYCCNPCVAAPTLSLMESDIPTLDRDVVPESGLPEQAFGTFTIRTARWIIGPCLEGIGLRLILMYSERVRA